MDLDRILPPGLLARLPLAPAPVRAAVERIADERAAERMTGLDALGRALWQGGRLTEHAAEGVPYAIALSCAPKLGVATAILLRLARIVAAIDEPPRSLSGASGTERQREVYDRIEADVPRLLRLASTGRDPARARLAACLAARFPAHDAQVEPLLVALLSGADDEDERARLLYALTRIQAGAGAPLHRKLAEAIERPPSDPGRFAVLLALASHDPPEPLRTRCHNALLEALSQPPTDPRAFGRQLDPAPLRALIDGLAA